MKKEEFKVHNGKDGKPAYISYKDRVYDVSGSIHWKDGIHMGRHRAGEDLTDFMAMAPHGEEVLGRIPDVGDVEPGTVDKSSERKMALSALYRKFHPHPIFIHFPIALYVFAMILQSIFLVTGLKSFELSAYYSISFATLTIFPAILSGFLSWWLNYDMTLTNIFKNKIIFSFVLLLTGITAVALRTVYTDIPVTDSSVSMIYNILIYLNVPVTGFISYNGGKITFPS